MVTAARKSSSYGQYCPLALAAELLCRRWTLLVVSRLIDGCRTFNEIHRGVPRISPSLLSTRLAELEHAGLLRRRRIRGENRFRYEPTDAALELSDIIDGLAVWGQNWSRDMVLEDLDPAFLAWSMSARMDTDAMPVGRTVIGFEFTGTPTELSRFWLVCEGDSVDMCLKDPGHDVDLLVRADIRRFVEAWRGLRDLRHEVHTGKVRLTGPRHLARAFPDWLRLSMFANVERRVRSREGRLSGRH